MAKRTVRGQGFSLYGLQPEISQAVDLLADALAKQGVEVNQDQLLLQIQAVVKAVGDGYVAPSGNYGYMQASDEPVPYSVAGDLLAIGYEQFKIGEKRQAVKTLMEAMNHDDFGDITVGLLAMNAKSSEQDNNISDDEDENEEDETDDEDDVDENEEDTDDDEDEDDEDLSDDDIDELLEDDEQEISAEDDDEENKDKGDDEEETEDKTEGKETDTKKPMKEEQPITASVNQRAIANKLSLSGDKIGRTKGIEFIKKVQKKVA